MPEMNALAYALKGFRYVLKKRALRSGENLPKPEIKEFDFIPNALGGRFSCGFAKADILPADFGKKKYYVAGYGENNPAEGFLDKPYVHALWLDDNSGRGGIVIVSIDDVGMLSRDVNTIRKRLREFAFISHCRSINVVSTHNHAGIDTMGIWGPLPFTGRDPGYMEFIFNTVVDCVKKAYEKRQNGRLFKGSVEVEDMQEDIRLPVVYSKTLTRLRFVPENGGRETWLLNFASHSESLQGCNSRVSADFPGYMRERISEEANADVIYCVGCIGGMISMEIPDEKEIRDAGGDFAESTKRIGRKLAGYAMDIKDEAELKPDISFARRECYFKADNTVLMLAAKAHIMKADSYCSSESPTGYVLKSELSYFEIDGFKILMLPCELFPELAYGGYLEADECATGLAPSSNPVPLVETAGSDVMFIGLANDEIGYVIPPNDFLLHETLPYAENGRDALGRRHYEETNSLGPDTAKTISACFEAIQADVENKKKLFN